MSIDEPLDEVDAFRCEQLKAKGSRTFTSGLSSTWADKTLLRKAWGSTMRFVGFDDVLDIFGISFWTIVFPSSLFRDDP